MFHGKSILSSAVFACALLAAPLAMAQTTPPPAAHHGGAKKGADEEAMLDRHIANIHDTLKITQQQEALWQPVAQTMRDNEKSMHELIKEKRSKIETQSALDDLNAYADITAAHAQNTRKLADSFATLYAALSDDQKKAADELFREHKHTAMKMHDPQEGVQR